VALGHPTNDGRDHEGDGNDETDGVGLSQLVSKERMAEGHDAQAHPRWTLCSDGEYGGVSPSRWLACFRIRLPAPKVPPAVSVPLPPVNQAGLGGVVAQGIDNIPGTAISTGQLVDQDIVMCKYVYPAG
jgi:hypothetical protein